MTGLNQLPSSYLIRNRSIYILTWDQKSVRKCWVCALLMGGLGTRIPAAEVVVIVIIHMTRTVIFIRSTTATIPGRRQFQILMYSGESNSKDVNHIFKYVYIQLVLFASIWSCTSTFLKKNADIFLKRWINYI